MGGGGGDILSKIYEEIRTEAKQLGALLDKSVMEAVEANNWVL